MTFAHWKRPPYTGDITFPSWQVTRLHTLFQKKYRAAAFHRATGMLSCIFMAPSSRYTRLRIVENSPTSISYVPYRWFITSEARPRFVPMSVCPIVPTPAALEMRRTNQFRLDPYSMIKVCDVPTKGSPTWTSRSATSIRGGRLSSQQLTAFPTSINGHSLVCLGPPFAMLLLISKLGVLQSTLQHRRMTPTEGPRPKRSRKDSARNHEKYCFEVRHVRV